MPLLQTVCVPQESESPSPATVQSAYWLAHTKLTKGRRHSTPGSPGPFEASLVATRGLKFYFSLTKRRVDLPKSPKTLPPFLPEPSCR